MKMDRRDFLKAAGAGSLGMMALPALNFDIRPAAAAAGQSMFHVVAVSKANVIDGVQHFAVAVGSGTFNMQSVEGGGPLLHFDNAPPPPKPVIAAGTWTAKRVANFAPLRVAGPLMAGVLDLEAEANVQAPAPAVIPFKLRIVCNLGPAKLLTGMPEGFTIVVPGTPFVPGGAGGPFEPLHPELGLTAFTPGAEAGAFDPAWEQEFQRAHGRAPSMQDRGDRLWSWYFLTRNGRPPNDAEWVAHWAALQNWMG